MELKGKTINFLGDSITEGASASTLDKTYWGVLEKKWELKAANCYGIGGTRIAKQIIPSENERHDKWFASRVDEMDENADAVVIFGGTNDYGHGDAPLGRMSDRTPDTFYGACHDLYQRVINKFPGKPIVIMTPIHRSTESEIHIKGTDQTVLKTYVDIIKEVAEYYSLPVCDMYSISGLQPKVEIINKNFFADGLHPNDAGHAIIGERLGNFLSNL